MKIGQQNILTISRTSDYGLYLKDDENLEVLLPSRYVTQDMKIGDKISVFLYRDSEDRPVATTTTPFAMVGDFAQLKITGVNAVGAFADWGLPKELLVPFSEQKLRLKPDRWYILYVYLDDNTGRIVASAKLEKFLNNVVPHYKVGDVTNILVWQRTDLGFKVIVDNLHSGMLYFNELPHELNIGERYQARVKRVRDDGKIDLTLGGHVSDRTKDISEKIMSMLGNSGGVLHVSDHSSPDVINRMLGCSKKDFKKAIGALFKQKLITIETDCIRSTE
ncbi:MAG: GntR family transcriptional regulator [Muribaculaceae bacterium]|nr:GntR family transcriptional regulator [Muribaculaceae bacterium]